MPVEARPSAKPAAKRQLADRRDKGLGHVNVLLKEVEGWAISEDWSVAWQDKLIEELPLESYEAPLLRIRTPQGEVRLDPVGSLITGAHGRLDIEAWPSLNRVRLIWRDGTMRIITESNVPLRQAWNRKTFVQLVNDLLMP